MHTPNFENKKIQQRCLKALAFVCSRFGNEPRAWSTRDINRHLGDNTKNPGKWLRETLLIETSSYYNHSQGKCKQFARNYPGVDHLRSCLGLSQKQVERVAYNSVHTEFSDIIRNQNFEYTDKSSRLWHPLQQVKKDVRQQVLAHEGYEYEYDISSAASTLLVQHTQFKNPDIDLAHIQEYIKNKDYHRQRLSALTSLSPDKIKQIINALLCGAPLTFNVNSAILNICGNNRSQVYLLKIDPWLTGYRLDVSRMWEEIFRGQTQRTTITGRRLPWGCSDKWAVYFQLERQVMDATSRYLRTKKIIPFKIHDGFTCNQGVDVIELSSYVRNKTGFDVTFDFKQIIKKIL